jgi:hypothetical protein
MDRTLYDIVKVLASKGLSTSILYDAERDQFYIDLEARAKSEMYLYEDGILRGRYKYESQQDLNDDIDLLIRSLCFEFKYAKHGRDYGNGDWSHLCKEYLGELYE